MVSRCSSEKGKKFPILRREDMGGNLRASHENPLFFPLTMKLYLRYMLLGTNPEKLKTGG
jgi:hypothetical protein